MVSKSVALTDFIAEISRLAARVGPLEDGDRDQEISEPTSRQLEIITEMARGKCAKAIAVTIGLSVPRTNDLIAEGATTVATPYPSPPTDPPHPSAGPAHLTGAYPRPAPGRYLSAALHPIRGRLCAV
jgi:hypothetical protein